MASGHARDARRVENMTKQVRAMGLRCLTHEARQDIEQIAKSMDRLSKKLAELDDGHEW